MEILVPIAIAFAAFVGLGLVVFVSWAAWQFYKIMKSLRDEIKTMNESMKGVPALMGGIKTICMELSGNTLKMSGAAEALRKGLLAEETSDPRRPGFLPYDTDKANAAFAAYQVAEAEAVSDLSDTFVVE